MFGSSYGCSPTSVRPRAALRFLRPAQSVNWDVIVGLSLSSDLEFKVNNKLGTIQRSLRLADASNAEVDCKSYSRFLIQWQASRVKRKGAVQVRTERVPPNSPVCHMLSQMRCQQQLLRTAAAGP